MNQNLITAGYHLLTILSSVDGDNDANENAVIMHYLHEYFPLEINANEELIFLDALERGHYDELFEKAAETFANLSAPEQRINFIQFASRLIKADNKVTAEEKHYFNKLCRLWSLSEIKAGS